MAVALITGCNSGFGFLTALELARRGDVVFATMRNLGKAEPLRRQALDEGLDISIVDLDVRDEGSVRAAVGKIHAEAGRIDALVNNAGVAAVGPLEEFDDAAVLKVFDTNVFGILRVTRAVLPIMRAQASGTIVNISSTSGLAVFPFCGLYAASKHAVEALSESLYHEVEPFGIRMVIVEPGLFRSELGRNSLTAGTGALYGERTQKVADVLDAGTRQGADPQLVATTVADAIHEPAPRLRYPVGESAVRMRELKRTMTDEEFAEAARRHVGI